MAPKKIKLRIAITADPELPIPPKFYGGIERIIDLLIRGLLARGHEITLFAHPDSKVLCPLEPYPRNGVLSYFSLLKNMGFISSKILRGKYDLVHSFGRLAYLLPILPLSIPKIMSYQRHITARSVRWAERLSWGTLHFVGLSRHTIKPYEGKKNWHVIYNGAPRKAYQLQEEIEHDAPLVFLGRIEEIKGTHLAIEVAWRTKRRLIIAGNLDETNLLYFKKKIEPHLSNGRIHYVGPVTDEEKNKILGRAVALLMPVQWEEPFGIVMAEALACGTPVIGFGRGAIPEVVQNGVNGFVCNTLDEMVGAVSQIPTIDRAVCRRTMEEKFSDCSIVDGYEQLYLQILGKV